MTIYLNVLIIGIWENLQKYYQRTCLKNTLAQEFLQNVRLQANIFLTDCMLLRNQDLRGEESDWLAIVDR